MWGDAFYVRDLLSENFVQDVRSPFKLLKLACVADVLGFYDYGLELLVYLTNNYGDNPQYNFSFLLKEIGS